MLELLFLLLPIAAAYGWYMGRRSAQQDNQQEANRLSRDYVAGVNFLLSDQQDKAVDLFVEMLKEDSSAFEAHLTLGNLFRSRGEVDRAIRIHQALIESAALSFEQKLLATQQLGRDYMSAGLYDRAEEMFTQLVNETEFRLLALKQLVTLHQATSDWLKAIETAEKLVKLGRSEYRAEIAHFYCELALQAILSSDTEKAVGLLKKATVADKNCARASIMRGRLLMEKAEYSKAIVEFEQVLNQDSELVSDALTSLNQCYQHSDHPESWEAFLSRCIEKDSGVSAELLYADILERQEGIEAAQNFVNQRLQIRPTMRGFRRLMDYHLAEAEEGRAKKSLVLLREIVAEQIKTKPKYRCLKCGFSAHSIYWHCPSCREWATVKPIRGLDGQ